MQQGDTGTYSPEQWLARIGRQLDPAATREVRTALARRTTELPSGPAHEEEYELIGRKRRKRQAPSAPTLYRTSLASLKARHRQELARLKAEQQLEVLTLREKHHSERTAVKTRHAREITRLRIATHLLQRAKRTTRKPPNVGRRTSSSGNTRRRK